MCKVLSRNMSIASITALLIGLSEEFTRNNVRLKALDLPESDTKAKLAILEQNSNVIAAAMSSIVVILNDMTGDISTSRTSNMSGGG